MKRQTNKIFLSLLTLISLILQTLPLRAQQTDLPATTIQEQNIQDRTNNFNNLLQQGRGTELKGLLIKLFGADAEAGQKALDEKADELFLTVGDAGSKKSEEIRQQEIEERKDSLKVELNPKSSSKNRTPRTKFLRGLNAPVAPRLDWRAFAFGFQPLAAPQDGKPDVKITQTDKEVKAEGESKKEFETDKASMKRTKGGIEIHQGRRGFRRRNQTHGNNRRKIENRKPVFSQGNRYDLEREGRRLPHRQRNLRGNRKGQCDGENDHYRRERGNGDRLAHRHGGHENDRLYRRRCRDDALRFRSRSGRNDSRL
jgi:hypothetical protein